VGKNGGPYTSEDYACGFLDASQRLAESLDETNVGIDRLIYPIIFNFRHGVEVALKSLAETLPRIWGEKRQPFQTHRLLDNWNLVTSYLGRERAFDPEATLVIEVDRIIRDLVSVDSTGEAFRFPKGRDGKLFLQNVSIINVSNIADLIAAVRTAFDWWHFTGDRLWDYRCEVHEHLYP
jgi:hypothetical protein